MGFGEKLLVFRLEKREVPVDHLGGGEDGHDTIIIPGWNGVKLVIMALRALERLPQKDLPHGIGDVIQPLLAGDLEHAHGRMLPRPHAQKAGGKQRLRIVRFPFISCQLLHDEGGIGLVLLEGPDDVVPVTPGVWAGIVIGKPR